MSRSSLTLCSVFGIVNIVNIPESNYKKHGQSNDQIQLIKRWLQPGLGVKRWLFLLILGITLIGLALAFLLLDIYRAYPSSPWLAVLSLSFLPRMLRAFLIGFIGLTILLLSVFRLNRSLLAPYVRPGKSVVDVVAEHRRLGRGPRIVAIGGGSGLATLLRGLKKHTGNLTAIVTVADDGGSSGRLRRSLGLPPPGDLRSCIAALSNDEDLLTQLFQYRFTEGAELNGHSFGNLFIAALAGVTGSFDRGILEAGNVLAIRGRVLPSTLENVTLVADKTPSVDAQAIQVKGESRIPDLPGEIGRVYLEPNDPAAYPEAIHSILNADMIILGPGSLYTSIMPNLLVPNIPEAIRSNRGFKLYVCNVATQPGETNGYNCVQHCAAIEKQIGDLLVDIVLANDRLDCALPKGVAPVFPPESGEITVPFYTADLVDEQRPWRHDSTKLAEVLIALLEERTGPLDLPTLDDLESVGELNEIA
jgi:uncharacterized cofD-like protein